MSYGKSNKKRWEPINWMLTKSLWLTFLRRNRSTCSNQLRLKTMIWRSIRMSSRKSTWGKWIRVSKETSWGRTQLIASFWSYKSKSIRKIRDCFWRIRKSSYCKSMNRSKKRSMMISRLASKVSRTELLLKRQETGSGLTISRKLWTEMIESLTITM